MILGGLVRIDLLECEGHPSTPQTPHIRITPFTNLPPHTTSTFKSLSILSSEPQTFHSRSSIIEIVTRHAMSSHLLPSLEMEIKSTGNAERNTIEIVIAGLGFVAVGGNFGRAIVRVWSPGGRGVGIRRPIVERIGGEFSLDVVRRRKVGRLTILGRKSIGAKIPEEFQDQEYL